MTNATRGINIRGMVIAVSMIVLGYTPSRGLADVIESTWIGPNGTWSYPLSWSPGIVPNNTADIQFHVSIGRGLIVNDVPAHVSHLALGGDVELELLEPLTIDSMIMRDGFINGEGALMITGDLDLRGGTINNQAPSPDGFSVGGTVFKRGFGSASLVPHDRRRDYPVVVEQGTLHLGNNGLEHVSTPLSVANTEFANIAIPDSASIADDIYLTNARGFALSGALVGSGLSIVQGDLFLGDQAAAIGTNPHGPSKGLRIFGAVHGGTLDIVGEGRVRIASDGHGYSGATLVGRRGEQTTLSLFGSGRLESTNHIELGAASTLELDNKRDGWREDRIADVLPIRSLGGSILLIGDGGATPVMEQLGALTLVQGATEVGVTEGTPQLVLHRVEHQGTSTLFFHGMPLAPLHSQRKISFTEPPTLQNSIIGGWALAGESDFATYDMEFGVLPLGSQIPRPMTLNSAGPNDHVVIQGPVSALSENRTIATLKLGQSINLSLAQHTLNIADGGLIGGPSEISDGVLTAGRGAGSSNLFVFHNSQPPLTISASIADNAAGGSVGLVNWGSGHLRLSGQNSYSGPTTVTGGRLSILNEMALPLGGDLVLHGGRLRFEFLPSEAKPIGTLQVSQMGSIESDGIFEIDAREYLLESGVVDVSLSGSGVLRKTSDGVVTLLRDSPNYNGVVTLEQGVLLIDRVPSGPTPTPLGTAVTSVLPGGILANGSLFPVNLNLQLNGGDVGLSDGGREGHWDFEGTWNLRSNSRLLMFDPTAGGGPVHPVMNVNAVVRLEDDTRLDILGEGTVTISNLLQLPGNRTAIASDDAIVKIGGVILSDVRQADVELDLIGAGRFAVDASIRLTSQSLAIRRNGEHVALTIAGDGKMVSGTGTLANDLLVADGAAIAPGDSIGLLTVDGSLTLQSEGRLLFELGGITPASSYDVLGATDRFVLGGRLDLSLLNGFVPELGDTFTIITAPQIEGAFRETVLASPGLDRGWHVNYLSDRVILEVVQGAGCAILGDARPCDNVVDIGDLNAVRNNFGSGDGSDRSGIPGDTVPFDGFVDLNDLNHVRNNFGEGVKLIPEPTSVALAWFGILLTLGLIHRPSTQLT